MSNDRLAVHARRRRAAERRFRWLGAAAVAISLGLVAVLFAAIALRGASGFVATTIAVPVALPAEPAQLPQAVVAGANSAFPREGGAALLADAAPRVALRMIGDGAWHAGERLTLRLPAAAWLDQARKGRASGAASQVAATLDARGVLSSAPDMSLLTGIDATDPASAGLRGAALGSLMTIAVTLTIALPLGVLAAIWLAEFAPPGRVTDALDLAINNLAAVPSIVFGLLGLALFLGSLHLPRSSPLVAGLTLALLVLPMVVITARAAIGAVSPSIRDAARALGASPVQVVVHHVLPLAAPGILTGAILATARALGETSPLLLIGMRAFVAAAPRSVTEPATVLPMQIFLWSDDVAPAFVERTAAAIIVLLALLLAMNGGALWLRARFEARR